MPFPLLAAMDALGAVGGDDIKRLPWTPQDYDAEWRRLKEFPESAAGEFRSDVANRDRVLGNQGGDPSDQRAAQLGQIRAQDNNQNAATMSDVGNRGRAQQAIADDVARALQGRQAAGALDATPTPPPPGNGITGGGGGDWRPNVVAQLPNGNVEGMPPNASFVPPNPINQVKPLAAVENGQPVITYPGGVRERDPVRAQMMWQYLNPTASLQGGVPVYSGGADPTAPSRADLAASVRARTAGELEEWDKSRSMSGMFGGGGLYGAQTEQAGGIGEHARASAASEPEKAKAMTLQAQAEMIRAKAAQQDIGIKEGVLKEGHVVPALPGQAPTPDQSRLSIGRVAPHVLQLIDNPKPGTQDPRYLSIVLDQINQGGYLNHPEIRRDIANVLRQQWGPEIDRIMRGGQEGFIGQATGVDPWGEMAKTRAMLSSLFPEVYGKSFQPPPQHAAQQSPLIQSLLNAGSGAADFGRSVASGFRKKQKPTQVAGY